MNLNDIRKEIMSKREKEELKSGFKGHEGDFFPETMREKDKGAVFKRIMNKDYFKYNFKSVIEHILKCVGYRNLDTLKRHRRLKRHFYHAKGEEKLNQQLDVIRMMKRLQSFEVMYSVIFPRETQLLL